MVVLVEVALDYSLAYEAYVLHLGVHVERAVQYLLDHVGSAVGTVDVDELGLLVDIGLVTVGRESLPERAQVGGHADYGTTLDIEVAGVIPTSDSKSGNMLERGIPRIGDGALGIAVELLVVQEEP